MSSIDKPLKATRDDHKNIKIMHQQFKKYLTNYVHELTIENQKKTHKIVAQQMNKNKKSHTYKVLGDWVKIDNISETGNKRKLINTF